MPFWVVYEKATGKHVSGSEDQTKLADPMPDHLAVKEVPSKPDLTAEVWDETNLEFIPIPASTPTRLEELRGRPTAGPGSGRYTEAERDEILNLLIGGEG